ncbi:hypothetical protein AVEN_11271-1 [Araneus ventricosus]|uniref:Uncharacterized protein n=1 Tax=Araneus ventricosus TaxID=182803 RepID=A0A4Y2GLZ6_ARAVE|nr:hypothetical protein AVEN_11271-1 [Araneus ventricosus]
MACCIGARLVNSVIKAIYASGIKVTLWSDSTVSLWWIKEYRDWSVFVANRVKEIRELTGFRSCSILLKPVKVFIFLKSNKLLDDIDCTQFHSLNAQNTMGPLSFVFT